MQLRFQPQTLARTAACSKTPAPEQANPVQLNTTTGDTFSLPTHLSTEFGRKRRGALLGSLAAVALSGLAYVPHLTRVGPDMLASVTSAQCPPERKGIQTIGGKVFSDCRDTGGRTPPPPVKRPTPPKE